MKLMTVADNVSYATMPDDEIRARFLVSDVFKPGEANLVLTDVDRAIVGGVVPLDTPLTLGNPKEVAADFFTQRREIGVLNIGGPGSVTVSGKSFELQNRDSLYVGRGNEEVLFSSSNSDDPARYALFSYPAHTAYPSKLVRRDEARTLEMGDDGRANDRVIRQSICPGIVDTCQLVMGFTQLEHGSVWNTMPPHTHRRRSEIYMYFDIEEEERVFHFMGEPNKFRTIMAKSGDAVVSPSWSVHFGVGTRPYTFIWSMGGENQEFDDMDSFSFE